MPLDTVIVLTEWLKGFVPKSVADSRFPIGAAPTPDAATFCQNERIGTLVGGGRTRLISCNINFLLHSDSIIQ